MSISRIFHFLPLVLAWAPMAIATARAQRLFPDKLNDCQKQYCFDCGDVKADVDEKAFQRVFDRLTFDYNLIGWTGYAEFQINIDSLGKACVVSANNMYTPGVNRQIAERLERFKKWKPAMSDGKPLPSSCITLRVMVVDEEVKGQILRLNYTERRETQLPPKDPKIVNTKYTYGTGHLEDYKISIWNAYDSGYVLTSQPPICTDKDGRITTVGEMGLVQKTDDELPLTCIPMATPEAQGFFTSLERAANGDWWAVRDNKVYQQNGERWIYRVRRKTAGFKIYKIISGKAEYEYMLCTNQGILVPEREKEEYFWTSLTRSRLPSDTVLFAKMDEQSNLWLGTLRGTVKLNTAYQLQAFTGESICLSNLCITSMTEDGQGNLYFSFVAIDKNATDKFSKQGGIIILKANGTIEHLSMYNSGLPVLNVKEVLYDKTEDVLWIATKTAGLVRYDLKENWEVYHQLNSPIPSAFVYSIKTNDKGDIFLGTDRGIVEMKKRGSEE